MFSVRSSVEDNNKDMDRIIKGANQIILTFGSHLNGYRKITLFGSGGGVLGLN